MLKISPYVQRRTPSLKHPHGLFTSFPSVEPQESNDLTENAHVMMPQARGLREEGGGERTSTHVNTRLDLHVYSLNSFDLEATDLSRPSFNSLRCWWTLTTQVDRRAYTGVTQQCSTG